MKAVRRMLEGVRDLLELRAVSGKDGLKKTWQDEFPPTTKCVHCGGESRHAFTAYEGIDGPEKKWISQMHRNDPKGAGYWPHDATATAVYFCRKCMGATALSNQA